MIQTDWILMKITHEQHISCRITRFVVSNYWRYEWDWNEHRQSCLLLVLLQKKTTWSMMFHDFQKHNITWDTIQWRYREDDISRWTVWFARIRNLQNVEKNHTLSLSMMISITWYVIWTIPMIMTIKYMISDFLRSLWKNHLSEKLAWRSIRKQILCILWDIINVRFSIFLRHVKMFFHQMSWHQSHPQNQKVNLHMKMTHYILSKFHWMKSVQSWCSTVFGQIFIWEICFR